VYACTLGALALTTVLAGCATAGGVPGTTAPESRVAIFYTPLGMCSALATTSRYDAPENGPGVIFLVARIDSIRADDAFAFDPVRMYINSPGQTEHGNAFDQHFTTVERVTVPPGGVPYPLGDLAVGYRTADRRSLMDAHAFRLSYDEHGVVVRQSHLDTRASEHPVCGETAVFTG
jgi:hypothetical protein